MKKSKIDFSINYEKTTLQIFFLLCKDVNNNNNNNNNTLILKNACDASLIAFYKERLKT